jgi:hypothetical protein
VQYLDAILGFFAILVAASLMVTAGTQVVISVLGLRGANLRRALANLFESACQDRDARRYSRVIARRVLHQPLVSGSVFSRTGLDLQGLPFLPADAAGKLRWAGSGIPMQPWLLGGVGGFFGWPVALWAMNRLFPGDVCSVADSVARYVPLLNLCEHPWRSGAILGAICGGLLSRSRLATSVRLDEVVEVLEKLAAPAGGTLPDPAQRAMLVVAGETRSRLRPNPKAPAAPSKAASSLSDRIEKIWDDGGDDLGGGVAVAVERPVTQAAGHAEGHAEGLPFWFDRAMERASQRFTMQARIITVILAALLVFGAHLDAVRLFQSLSADAQVRSQLAASADAMTRLAEQFPRGRESGFSTGRESGRSVVPEVYRAAMTAVLALPPAPSEPAKTKTRHSSHSTATPLTDLSGSASEAQIGAGENSGLGGQARTGLEAKIQASKALAEIRGFASREDALLWLRQTLDGDPAVEPLVAAYEQELNAELPSDADKLVDHSASIRAELNRSKLQLVPETWRGWVPIGNELPGLLLAVAFLSLGSTICSNLLKRIASLRPLPTIK